MTQRSGSIAEYIRSRVTVEDRGYSSPCWIWQRQKNEKGYGYGEHISRGKGRFRIHRASFETHVGPIPDGMMIDHRCRQRACCNPAHLEPVTNSQNQLRRYAALRELEGA